MDIITILDVRNERLNISGKYNILKKRRCFPNQTSIFYLFYSQIGKSHLIIPLIRLISNLNLIPNISGNIQRKCVKYRTKNFIQVKPT